jgi:hypothetical protein
MPLYCAAGLGPLAEGNALHKAAMLNNLDDAKARNMTLTTSNRLDCAPLAVRRPCSEVGRNQATQWT